MENVANRIILDHHRILRSYGLLVIARDTRRAVVVQRRHSIGYLILSSGNYRLSQLEILLASLTHNEAELLMENSTISHDQLIHAKLVDRTDYSTLAFTIPKGTREIHESGLQCATREWTEEVGQDLPLVQWRTNYPLVMVELSSLGRNLETIIYLEVIDYEFELTNHEMTDEVSSRKWVTFHELGGWYPGLEKVLDNLI